MLRSVCNLWLQKRMRSYDATCCAILAVNTWVFTLSSYYIKNTSARITKTWSLTHYHVPIRLPKTAHLIMMAFKFFSSSKMSKTGKNVKNPLYIRYNLKIRYIKKVKNRFSIDWECSGQFATFGNSNGWLLPVIHAIYVSVYRNPQQYWKVHNSNCCTAKSIRN